MLIRASDQKDLDALRSLWRMTWRETYGPELGLDAAFIIDSSVAGDAVHRMFASDGGCLVAVDRGEIVGSLCFVERGPVAYVWGLYVHPGHQRSGIGTMLLRGAASAFQEAEWIDCSAVDAGALAFYRALGFAEQGPGEVELFPGVRRPTTRLMSRSAISAVGRGRNLPDISPRRLSRRRSSSVSSGGRSSCS